MALSDSHKQGSEIQEDNKDRVSAVMAEDSAAADSHLTIFYNGSIVVFDAITPAKAQAIMMVAAASAAASRAESSNNKSTMNTVAGANAAAVSAAAAAALTRSLSRQSSSAAAAATHQAQIPSSPGANPICKLQAELPHARRHSLQQFLEKRRSRLVSKAPYAPGKKSGEGLEAVSEAVKLSQ